MSKWVWWVWKVLGEEFGAYFLVFSMVDFLFQTMSFFVVGFWWWVSLFWWWVSLTMDFRQWFLMLGFFVWRVFIGLEVVGCSWFLQNPFFIILFSLGFLFFLFVLFWEESHKRGGKIYIFIHVFNRDGLRKINWANLRLVEWYFSNHR